MVRGASNQKTELPCNNVSPVKPRARRKQRGNLSHSGHNSKKTSKSETSRARAMNLTEMKFSSNSVSLNPITNYYNFTKKDEKSSENLSIPMPTSDNSNKEEQKNLTEVNYACRNAQESKERLENDRFGEKSTTVLKDSGNSTNPQTKLTEFFPVRRSVRKTEKTVLKEKKKTLVEAILSNKEDGLEIRIFNGKGRGIVATKKFYKGEFVVEYAGELISMDEAQKREANYSQDENIGCYMYYFKHRNEQHCIDATAETNRLGRLLNHSRYGNLSTKTVEINGVPHLILIAKEDIEPDCELTYDYGDRSKLSLQYHPWLAQ